MACSRAWRNVQGRAVAESRKDERGGQWAIGVCTFLCFGFYFALIPLCCLRPIFLGLGRVVGSTEKIGDGG